MIKTELCNLLGVEYPIIQGGMAWIADAPLAAAVSNAGGLGIISAMNAGADWVREEIRKAKEMTQRPFGVNIMLMSPFVEEVAQVAAEEKVSVVITGAGNPPARYIRLWKEAGSKVIAVIPSVAIARMAQRNGVDAVVAEGGESGGHVGDLTTMTLVPQVLDAVTIPVIAAGGIGDGRGLAAAIMLGACGVQVGTRFLVATECTVHENYKKKILKAKDTDTISTGKRLGHPVRALKNPFTRGFFKREFDSTVSDQELEAYGAGALRMAAKEGDEKNGCFMAGQIAGLVKKEQTSAEIISEMFQEAETVMKTRMSVIQP